MIRKGISRLITWLGVALIGLLALPAGVLVLLIIGIWSLVDRLASRLGREKDSTCIERED